jgi:hypothetical protein
LRYINVNIDIDGKRGRSSIAGGKGNAGRAVDQLPSGVRNSAERRSSPRSAFTAEAVTVEPKSGARIEAHTSDLSLGGCYVDTMNPFPAGTELQLRLTAEGKSFHAKARVAYCQIGVGMGLAFTTVEPEQLSTLEKWFAEIRGETQPEPDVLADEEQPLYRATAKNEEHYILEELLVLMMRKGLLTEEEGEPILRRLLR